MHTDDRYRHYQELQSYVGWTDDDARRVRSVGALLDPLFPALIDDFYAEIERHPDACKVITGGAAQIARLKNTLLNWLRELFGGSYDREYVARRWRVGWRHVEIGLDQVYTNVALSRLRRGLLFSLEEVGPKDHSEAAAVRRSLNTLLDLDLVIIEDAYAEEYAARLQRGERLAAIGQVAGGIAHELRNPLNVIKTSVYYLVNARTPNPTKIAEHLQRIERHVLTADSVITALSDFVRMPLPNRRPFGLLQCLSEVLEVTAMPANIRVDVDVPPTLPPVFADVDQVRIVLGNLIRNAREAMPQGGDLILRAVVAGDKVEASVTDTGVGIAPDNLARILEPLFSTKARGLGLGLAIARAILEKNQGALCVRSEFGRGSTFTVRLPVAAV